MSPESRLILIMGRACLRERAKLLEMPPLSPDLEQRIAFSHQTERVRALWDCYKMVYERLFSAWPRWQLRFY